MSEISPTIKNRWKNPNRKQFGYRIHYYFDHHHNIRDLFLTLNKPIWWIINKLKTYKNIVEAQQIKSKLADCGEDVNTLTQLRISEPSRVKMGNNIYWGQNIFMASEGGVEIGSNCDISDDLVIYTWEHGFRNDWIPFDDKKVCRKLIIKDNVWIGRRVMIRGGITIGNGAVIGMGSVVLKDVPDLAIVAGNPAKIIGWRDKKMYDKALKSGKLYDMMETCKIVIENGKVILDHEPTIYEYDEDKK